MSQDLLPSDITASVLRLLFAFYGSCLSPCGDSSATSHGHRHGCLHGALTYGASDLTRSSRWSEPMDSGPAP
jgi:hypothetical protein